MITFTRNKPPPSILNRGNVVTGNGFSFRTTTAILACLFSNALLSSAWTCSCIETRWKRSRSSATSDNSWKRIVTYPNQHRPSSPPFHSSLSQSIDDTNQSISSPISTNNSSNNNNTNNWVNYGLFFSSFTDGILPSAEANEFLLYGIARVLLSRHIRQAEHLLEESVQYSPCAGPDVARLNGLERVDRAAAWMLHGDDHDDAIKDGDTRRRRQDRTQRIFQKRNEIQIQSSEETEKHVRILYIPTAMYALRADSGNSPGKQRQRARADGKKRRNVIVSHVERLLNVQWKNEGGRGDWGGVSAVTLDLDDGSIKQPYVTGGDDGLEMCCFPKNGKEAFHQWKPHLIYVEGGNTFWLQHCIDKGGWADDIRAACAGLDASAIYLGKSAGAIVGGLRVDTATWKGWDDPSIVPGRERYEDWKSSSGLNLAGGSSFFPHMSSEWEGVVMDQLEQWRDKEEEDNNNQEKNQKTLYQLRESDVCCVEGQERDVFVAVASSE